MKKKVMLWGYPTDLNDEKTQCVFDTRHNHNKYYVEGVIVPMFEVFPCKLYGTLDDENNRFIVDGFDYKKPNDYISPNDQYRFLKVIGFPEDSSSQACINHIDIEEFIQKSMDKMSRSNRLKWVAIQGSWNLNFMREEFSQLEILKIYRKMLNYEAKSMELQDIKPIDMLIKENPFILTHIGFDYNKTNHLAKRLHKDGGSLFMEALLTKLIKTEENRGHTFSTLNGLIYQAEMDPDAAKAHYQATDFEYLIYNNSNFVVRPLPDEEGGPAVYLKDAYKTENTIVEEVARIISGDIKHISNFDKFIKNEEKRVGFELAPMQKNAVASALNHKFSVITGGPGTGKSTIMQVIVSIYKKAIGGKISLMAPTGKAAQRMTECVEGLLDEPAGTIHKVLKLMPNSQIGDGKPLDADLVMIDESSMINADIAAKMLSLIKTSAQVILIGDPQQLPPIGYGSFLEDLISSHAIPVAKLNAIFRQKSTSSVAINAAKIRDDDYEMMSDENFQFIESKSYEQSTRQIVECYVKEAEIFGTDQVCVLTPRRVNLPTSSDAINVAIQNVMTPNEKSIKVGRQEFHENDRIMMTKNIEAVSNGDTGFITAIEGNSIYLNFDGYLLSFDRSSDLAKSMRLGYAMTVHKSQSSEYKCIILNVQNNDIASLSPDGTGHPGVKRNWIYTGITRAKQRVIVVGEKEAFMKGIKLKEEKKRRSMLSQLLDERLSPGLKQKRI